MSPTDKNNPATVPQDILDELQRYDDAYSPEAWFRPGVEALPDGDYEFEIVSVGLERTQKTRDLIFRRSLRVLSGPCARQEVDWVAFFKQQLSINLLGGELIALGLPADRWTRQSGAAFSQELVRHMDRLRGRRFRGRKSTDGQYPRLHVHYLLGSTTATANGAAPSPARPAAPTPAPRMPTHWPEEEEAHAPPPDDDEEIPF